MSLNPITNGDLAVPTADVATNVDVVDVVGNKTDAAVGAATTDKSLMGYVKGILTDTAVIGATGSGLTSLATQASVDTIDGLVDKIPASDAAVTWNSTALASIEAEAIDALESFKLNELNDEAVTTNLQTAVDDASILGYAMSAANVSNFDRTTDSLEALGTNMAIVAATTPRILERTTSNLPQATQSALFTITGDVIITRIVGKVTTQIQAQETVVKLVANPTGLADVDVCAALDINGDAVGTKLNVTGTFANAMIASTNGVFELQPNAFELSAGTLDLDTDNDSSTGQIQWTIHYIKGSSDGAVVVA